MKTNTYHIVYFCEVTLPASQIQKGFYNSKFLNSPGNLVLCIVFALNICEFKFNKLTVLNVTIQVTLKHIPLNIQQQNNLKFLNIWGSGIVNILK